MYVLSCEICEIFEDNIFYRAPSVKAYGLHTPHWVRL